MYLHPCLPTVIVFFFFFFFSFFFSLLFFFFFFFFSLLFLSSFSATHLLCSLTLVVSVIRLHRLQSLLELAVRSSLSGDDVGKDSLSCALLSMSVLDQLKRPMPFSPVQKASDVTTSVSGAAELAMPSSLSGTQTGV
jgi:hypothetical protein